MDIDKRLFRRMREHNTAMRVMGNYFGCSKQRIEQLCKEWGILPKKKTERKESYAQRKYKDLRSRIILNADTRCWEFQGYIDKLGYGRYSYVGSSDYAHRVMYSLHHQINIPIDICVCHLCDNPSCINPAHLWLGTTKENMVDRSNKRKNKSDFSLLRQLEDISRKIVEKVEMS